MRRLLCRLPETGKLAISHGGNIIPQGDAMRKAFRPSSPAEMYDHALRYARDKRLPRNYPKPRPTAEWPAENIVLLEQYCEWLRSGGASPVVIRNIYLPIGGHVLGPVLKPYPLVHLEVDLLRRVDIIHAIQLSSQRTDDRQNCY